MNTIKYIFISFISMVFMGMSAFSMAMPIAKITVKNQSNAQLYWQSSAQKLTLQTSRKIMPLKPGIMPLIFNLQFSSSSSPATNINIGSSSGSSDQCTVIVNPSNSGKVSLKNNKNCSLTCPIPPLVCTVTIK